LWNKSAFNQKEAITVQLSKFILDVGVSQFSLSFVQSSHKENKIFGLGFMKKLAIINIT